MNDYKPTRAGAPSPGARLLAVAKNVRPGQVVADIGADHGKLGVYLVCSGHSPRVIAVDKRPAPLARARSLAAEKGCADRVDCRLGEGLQPLQPMEAGDIVIAGLSGETIVEILNRAAWVKDARLHLLLLPSTRTPHLRRWLLKEGFALQSETPVEDAGRYYTVMSAAYTGEMTWADDLFCEVGLLADSRTRAAQEILKNRLRDLEKRTLAPLEAAEQDKLQKLIEGVKGCLQSAKSQT